MTDTRADDFLTHYGVAGMKWGKRKKYTESRREYKQRVRGEKTKHETDHLSSVINTSLRKGDKVIISTQVQGTYGQTLMTGKQFVEMAGKGAALNAKLTDVFATYDDKQKGYAPNAPAATYTPSERK